MAAISIAENRDCMDAMRAFPDGYFDIAVVDPPYGDAVASAAVDHLHSRVRAQERERERENADEPTYNRFGGRFERYKRPTDKAGRTAKKTIAWDVAPGKEYFNELFRVSRNQIIWGGNYFDLPPTRCFLVWRKTNIPLDGFSMSPVEYAWTSFDRNAKIIEASSTGLPGERFHPTAKPIELYAKVFCEFTKPGMRVLDTHLGSGSSRIAAWDAGLDFWGYEIDSWYFEKEEERFEAHRAQANLFLMEQGD